MNLLPILLGGMVLMLASQAGVDSATEVQAATIRVVDLTPRFLQFHAQAAKADNSEERFALWQQHYDFVALPPGLPDRDERAQRMLEAAWPRYAEVLDRVEVGSAGLSPSPAVVIARVAELFEIRDGLPPITLLYYVGMFDDNAFFAAQPDGTLFVALPAEMAPERRELVMAHELAHALHYGLSQGVPDGAGSVAALVLSEGIAMHATRALFPELPDERHLGGGEGWADACHAGVEQILQALPEFLEAQGTEVRHRFTLGDGVSGLNREAYCAGWHLVGRLLETGWTLAKLARLNETELIDLLSSALADSRILPSMAACSVSSCGPAPAPEFP